MENVYKHVPKEMLPVEYLPDDYTGPNAGTVQELSGKGRDMSRSRNGHLV